MVRTPTTALVVLVTLAMLLVFSTSCLERFQKKTAEDPHAGETAEEHAAHSHEGETAEEHAAHSHEGETAEEHAAHSEGGDEKDEHKEGESHEGDGK